MSTPSSAPGKRAPHIPSTLPSPFQLPKPQRVLACPRCQQSKIKCDRKYPCSNCIKSHSQCMQPAPVLRQRKRRFPERELLERLKGYEDLLRRNDVKFEPLHSVASVGEKEVGNIEFGGGDEEDDEQAMRGGGGDWPTSETSVNYERNGTTDIMQDVGQQCQRPPNNNESSEGETFHVVTKKAWDHLFANDEYLLFSPPNTANEISTLHPEPVQILRLWQVYLENVDPLLKVTHTPSLQGRIIEAASNLSGIAPTFEALMFSIYCMSILSLDIDDCQATMGSKADLLRKYQFGCQQALSNAGFLRSSDRECLTALYFYLLSVFPSTAPQSLSSMLGLAVRIAQRIGIHSESALVKCSPHEAELRRRLWWSLISFDERIGQLAEFKADLLTASCDCKIPLNVNDYDLRIEMKAAPLSQGKPSEALFAVVRSEIVEFSRRTGLNQNSPTSSLIDLPTLSKRLEEKYLTHLDPTNVLHIMTLQTTLSTLAKLNLLSIYSTATPPFTPLSPSEHTTALTHAITMLSCDTKIRTSPSMKGFLWLTHIYFPAIAYIQIVQTIKRRPLCAEAEEAWDVMSSNYEAHRPDFLRIDRADGLFFKIFAKTVLQAWEAREASAMQSVRPDQTLQIPSIVKSIREKLALSGKDEHIAEVGRESGVVDMNMGMNGFFMSMPMGFMEPPDMSGMASLGGAFDGGGWGGMD